MPPAAGLWLTGMFRAWRVVPSNSTAPDNGSAYVASADLYDPTSNTFTATGGMSAPRGAFAAAIMVNGEVLVTGGVGNFGAIPGAERY